MSAHSHPESYVCYRFEELNGKLKRAVVDWKDPKEGEVVIKVLACGVCGSDAVVPSQTYPTGFPRVPGHEVVGDIVAVPEGEEIYKVGDRVGAGWHGGHCGRCSHCLKGDFIMCEHEDITGVFRDGGYAEYTTLRVESVVPIPKEMDPAEAAPLLCAGITTYNSLRNMNVHAPELVAVQGIGGLGHLALQFSQAMGFHTVAVSSGDSKRELALSLGATEYLDGSKVDLVKALEELGGAKVIVCTAPNPKAYQGLVPALAVDGTLLLLGITLEDASFNTVPLLLKRASIRGWASGTAADGVDTIKFANQNGIKCMVQKYPLEKAQEAYDHRDTARFRSVIVP
ncbi:hypothetical protein EIP86_009940 [Pleurotus ostreatoroseus]|nr:hypothetical protein EIP86_009940 [Pleurotus ostreatoroseus]